MGKIRLEKYSNGVGKIACPKNGETKKNTEEEPENKAGDFATEFDDEDERMKKNIEEFYRTRNAQSESKKIRKYFVETDKIIDKRL